MPHDVIAGSQRELGVFLISGKTVRGRERPKDSGVEDRPLGCIGMETVESVAGTVVAAAGIDHLLSPIR